MNPTNPQTNRETLAAIAMSVLPSVVAGEYRLLADAKTATDENEFNQSCVDAAFDIAKRFLAKASSR